jgi:hypothetical protein
MSTSHEAATKGCRTSVERRISDHEVFHQRTGCIRDESRCQTDLSLTAAVSEETVIQNDSSSSPPSSVHHRPSQNPRVSPRETPAKQKIYVKRSSCPFSAKAKKRPTALVLEPSCNNQKQQPPALVTFVPGFTLSQGSLALPPPPGGISNSLGLAPKYEHRYRYHCCIAHHCENRRDATNVHPTLSALR